VIQKVNPVKARSLVAATVKYSFMHAFISDQGTDMAYTLGVALQPSSRSIRSPSASLPSAVPLHLSFQRIQSSVLLEKGGESWRMCYHGNWAERTHHNGRDRFKQSSCTRFMVRWLFSGHFREGFRDGSGLYVKTRTEYRMKSFL
jgi:hypothetical protein